MNTSVLLALLTAFSMACGQILFKLGAGNWTGNSLAEWFWSFILNPFLMTAIFLYAFTIVVWIFVLRTLPLSIAYPLTALSYVIVPLLSFFIAHEKITLQTAIGSLIIIVGVIVIHIQRN